MRVTREIAILVFLLTARGVLGIKGDASWLACPVTTILVSFHFTTPSTRCGLNGMILTASQATLIFSGVKVCLRAGIRILKDSWLILVTKTPGMNLTYSKNSPLFIPACPFRINLSSPLL